MKFQYLIVVFEHVLKKETQDESSFVSFVLGFAEIEDFGSIDSWPYPVLFARPFQHAWALYTFDLYTFAIQICRL